MSKIKVRAAVLREKSKPFVIEELELEEPRADEILVRNVATGICHTDLTVRDQHLPVPLPIVLGHEGTGIVEQVGERVTKVQPGDSVVLSYNHCGHCNNCKRGHPYYCEGFFSLNFGGSRQDGSSPLSKDGDIIHGSFFGQSSFATHSLVTEKNAVKVGNNIPLELLGPLGCGIQSGAGAVLNAFKADIGSSIAVFGTGALGLSAIMAAQVAGCRIVIGVDINSDRLDLARSLGATHTINPDVEDVLGNIRRFSGGGVDYSLEFTGQPTVFRQAIEVLAPLGICGIMAGAPPGTDFSFSPESVLVGRRIMGILEGESVPDLFIPLLIDLYEKGRFPFDKLIKTYPFEDINQAVADSEKGVTVKPVLKF